MVAILFSYILPNCPKWSLSDQENHRKRFYFYRNGYHLTFYGIPPGIGFLLENEN